jgi:hypothetical protein
VSLRFKDEKALTQFRIFRAGSAQIEEPRAFECVANAMPIPLIFSKGAIMIGEMSRSHSFESGRPRCERIVVDKSPLHQLRPNPTLRGSMSVIACLRQSSDCGMLCVNGTRPQGELGVECYGGLVLPSSALAISCGGSEHGI